MVIVWVAGFLALFLFLARLVFAGATGPAGADRKDSLSASVSEGNAEPAAIRDGLAIYRSGEGAPLLLFPYPHASTRAPMSESPLAEIFRGLGWSVITFDPPQAYRSTRAADFSLAEMIACADEALDFFGIEGPVPVAGHSMGSFCALAYGIERPSRVECLTLICGNTGFPSVSSQWFGSGGIPLSDMLKMTYLGARQITGTGNYAIQKRMANLVDYHCFVDKSKFVPETVSSGDSRRASPPRSAWMDTVRREDYSGRVSEIAVPALVVSGTGDILSSESLNRAVSESIRGSTLAVFGRSRHYPFIEEEDAFRERVGSFLSGFRPKA